MLMLGDKSYASEIARGYFENQSFSETHKAEID